MASMKDEIFISLKPEFADLIERQEKTHEFRKWKPTRKVRRFWIYVTKPVALLKYVADVGDVAEYPQKNPWYWGWKCGIQ